MRITKGSEVICEPIKLHQNTEKRQTSCTKSIKTTVKNITSDTVKNCKDL